MQPTHSQPDVKHIARQLLQPAATAIGEHVGMVRMRGAEDFYRPSEQMIDAAAHVHKGYAVLQPSRY